MLLREFLVKKSIRAKELNDFSTLPVYGVSNVDGICVTGNNPGEKKDEYILIEENDFAYNPYRINVGSIGLTLKGMKGLVSPAYVVFQTNENLLPELLWAFIKSKEGLTQIISHAKGTVRKALRFEDLCKVDMYIPPKNEQKKILQILQIQKSKIQILKSETSHQLDLLKKLKQQILQDAVQGKLVKQNPKDEPASVLLKKIKAEKEKLIKEKKLKPGKPLSPIKKDEIPFQIPENWVWRRLGEIGIINPRNYADDEIYASFIPMPLITNKFGISPEFEIRKWKNIKSGFTHFANNDVAVAKITPCFENSKACVFKNLKNGIGAGTTELHVFRTIINNFSAQYIYINFKTNRYLIDGERNMRGVAGQKRVPTNFFRDFEIPLPPLSEQHRIVSKVEELMKMCDELEARIKQGQIYTDQLMQSVLRDALKPGRDKIVE